MGTPLAVDLGVAAAAEDDQIPGIVVERVEVEVVDVETAPAFTVLALEPGSLQSLGTKFLHPLAGMRVPGGRGLEPMLRAAVPSGDARSTNDAEAPGHYNHPSTRLVCFGAVAASSAIAKLTTPSI